MTDAQVDEIKAAKEKLMTSAQNLFAKMYEATQGAGAAGAGSIWEQVQVLMQVHRAAAHLMAMML